MKTETVVEKKISLILNEAEAKYLKGLVQNYIRGGGLEGEPVQERRIRMCFWEALKEVEI